MINGVTMPIQIDDLLRQALAEDIVRGQAVEMDCIFKMREKVQSLAQQMIDLSNMQNL